MPEDKEIFKNAKNHFWRCPKIKDFKGCYFWQIPKNDEFGILPKMKCYFWRGDVCISYKKKGGIYEKEKLQRSKVYQEVCGKV